MTAPDIVALRRLANTLREMFMSFSAADVDAAADRIEQLERAEALMRRNATDWMESTQKAEARISQLECELERERVRLAACGVAAMRIAALEDELAQAERSREAYEAKHKQLSQMWVDEKYRADKAEDELAQVRAERDAAQRGNGELRAVFRVNMLRYCTEANIDAEIDRILDAARGA